ncbi:MAG: Smr/MutS family protein [Xanthomonadales bacterium]|nr:Smr/MutS family protein [Xanthomonadales bacterium]
MSRKDDRTPDGEECWETRAGDDGEDDAALFREAMADARPLELEPRVVHQRPRPAPVPRQRLRDERAVLEELLEEPVPGEDLELETGEELRFLRNGYPPRLIKRLRRGDFVIHMHLDLHHMTHDVARDNLLAFLDDAVRRDAGCVRIVHGKGLRSRRGPVLKMLVNRLLRRHPSVIAFTSCRPVDGGTGAVVVLLRPRRH